MSGGLDQVIPTGLIALKKWRAFFMAKCKVAKMKKEQAGSWQEALAEFLWWKQAQGLSKTTIDDYRNYPGSSKTTPLLTILLS